MAYNGWTKPRTKEQERERKRRSKERKAQNTESSDPLDVKKQKLSSHIEEDRTPISLNKRGFLLPRNKGNRGQIALDTIQLLNKYADKLYRTNGKSCYFEDKLLSKVGRSPIFIESDIEDPSLLVDAILTDLREGDKDIDVEKMKLLSRFLPVINTCTIECEDIIENVKAVLEPVLAERPSGTEFGFFKLILHGQTLKEDGTRTKVIDGIMDFLASKGIQVNLELETNSKYLINLITCRNGYTVNSDKIPSEICCITLTKKNDLVKGYYVNKNILKTEVESNASEDKERKAQNAEIGDPLDLKKQKLSSHIEEDRTPISLNKRGFLLPRNKGNRGQIALDTIQLLNKYADKLYRTNGKSCYFEDKLLSKVGRSPIFIESDIEDPSLLVDAILRDLREGGKDIDVEKMKLLSRFLPVINTCTIECEDIIENVKAVLEPVLAERPSGTEVGFFKLILHGQTLKEDGTRTKVIDGIMDFLASKGIQVNLELETDSKYLISLTTCRNGYTVNSDKIPSEICCITLTKKNDLVKGYYVNKNILKTEIESNASEDTISEGEKNLKEIRQYISPDKKGFLLSYHQNYKKKKIVSYAIQVLNEYADKLFRTDEKSCYFVERVIGRPDKSHIFIESDIADPSLLVDAILKDLDAGNPGIDTEKVELWTELFPVNTICIVNDADELLQKVKELVEPVFGDLNNGGKVPRLEMHADGKHVSNKSFRDKVLGYFALRGEQEKCTLENGSTDVITIKTFSKNKQDRWVVCCMSLLKNIVAWKKEDSAISSGKRGFLLYYAKTCDHKEIVSNVIQLLNQYADKLYGDSNKSCYFEEKVIGGPNRSPIYIESNIDDPSLLVDAILKDLQAVDQSIDIQNVKNWTGLLPVNTTCVTDDEEEILQKVKELVEPVFRDAGNIGQIPVLKVYVDGPRWAPKKGIIDKILEYTALRREQENLVLQSNTRDVLKIRSFHQHKLGKIAHTFTVCCISLSRNSKSSEMLFDRYSINTFHDRYVQERATEELSPAVQLKGQQVKHVQKVQATFNGPNLTIDTRGFLVTWKGGWYRESDDYHKIVSDVIELLNEYADKTHRGDGTSCYFEHKLINPEGHAPIFIETDLDDPAVIVDAYFADLLSNKWSGGKQLDPSFRFEPLNTTCHATSEDIIRNIKSLLDLESVSGKLKFFDKIDVSNVSETVPDRTDDAKLTTYNIKVKRPFLAPSQKKELFRQVREYLALRGVVQSKRKTFPDLLIKLCDFGEFCCISLLTNLEQRNTMSNVKSKIDETLEDKEVNWKMETES